MILTDTDIRNGIEFDALITIPHYEYSHHPEMYEPSIQPASYDLTLSRSFKKIKMQDCKYPNKTYVDFGDEIEYIDVPYDGGCYDGVVIAPGEFMLGASREIITLPKNLSALITGRSSIGRAGLIVETAGWVDPCFTGSITLEFYNCGCNPIRLTEGIRIAQIVFMKNTGDCAVPYNGKYQHQLEATESRIHLDKEVHV